MVNKLSAVFSGHWALAIVPPNNVASVPTDGETVILPWTAAAAVPVDTALSTSVAPPTARATPNRPADRARACLDVCSMWLFLHEGEGDDGSNGRPGVGCAPFAPGNTVGGR